MRSSAAPSAEVQPLASPSMAKASPTCSRAIPAMTSLSVALVAAARDASARPAAGSPIPARLAPPLTMTARRGCCDRNRGQTPRAKPVSHRIQIIVEIPAALRERHTRRQPDDELNRELPIRRRRERRSGQLINMIEETGEPDLAGTTGYIPARQAGLHDEWHAVAGRAPVQDDHSADPGTPHSAAQPAAVRSILPMDRQIPRSTPDDTQTRCAQACCAPRRTEPTTRGLKVQSRLNQRALSCPMSSPGPAPVPARTAAASHASNGRVFVHGARAPTEHPDRTRRRRVQTPPQDHVAVSRELPVSTNDRCRTDPRPARRARAGSTAGWWATRVAGRPYR